MRARARMPLKRLVCLTLSKVVGGSRRILTLLASLTVNAIRDII